MTDGTFKVEVPIQIKGGRNEGKKIGEEIAKSIERSMKSLGFGSTSSKLTGSVVA